MSEMSRLRMELKADLELMAIRQGEEARHRELMSQRIEEHGRRIAAQGERIAAQGEQIAAQAQQIAAQGHHIAGLAREFHEYSQETARLGLKSAENSRWMEGRMRLVQQRFDTMFDLAERERTEDRSLLLELQTQQQALESRVTRLEEGSSPAA